ncbi:uracil nucleotide/cysteinyl leukotriene receptor-like [Centroberyx affinis]|uniref:uracil nucleotide/cysteinyl leukotriene receptor-like n=1 Tax=Centroberyx affinis TaxID=166261 RepID=UPI003A5C76DC
MINSFLGLVTNCWFLKLVTGGSLVQINQEMLSINLAIMEVIYCLLSPLLVLNIIVFVNQTILRCSWYIYGLVNIGRPFFQSCICVERYLAVVHPVVFLRYKPLRYRVACSALVWLATLILAILYGLNPCIEFTATIFIIVLITDVFCCISILLVLRRDGPGEGMKDRNKDRKNGGKTMKDRASQTVLIILAIFAINYIPVIMGAVAYYIGISSWSYDCVVMSLTFSFCLLGSFTQPLLYLHKAGKLPCC